MSTEILKSREAYDQAVQQFIKLSQEVNIYLKINFLVRFFFEGFGFEGCSFS